jgi:D-arabinose 1-dehydrogenase-like Zn-dependent alcohol dehydrogenase
MLVCTGFAAPSATEPLEKISFNRRDVGPRDVQIEILFCGICHSDLHFVRNEWKFTVYPACPEHEIAETQEMLDFCAAHKLSADVEIIPIQKFNESYERMLKSDVKYRFSIDMVSLTAA